MRHAAALLALLLLLAPLALADTQTGRTVGVNLGYVAPGLWDVVHLNTLGGGVTLQLSWAASLFPGADYDLHLYPASACTAQGVCTFNPTTRLANSSTRTFAAHTETIAASLSAGNYYAAIVPFQTQGETYTLTSTSGTLDWWGVAPGYIHRCQPPVTVGC